MTAQALTCDGCGTELQLRVAQTPQEAIVTAIIAYRWSIVGEHRHCADCPPLCGFCGAEQFWAGPCPGCGADDGQS